MPENTGEHRTINVTTIFKISIVINVLLLGLTLISLLYLFCKDTQSTSYTKGLDNQNNLVCVPDDLDDQLLKCDDRKTMENGQMMCCFEDGSVYVKMVLKVLEAKQHKVVDMNKQHGHHNEKHEDNDVFWWTNRDFSAHLYGFPSPRLDGDLEWTTHDTLGTAYINKVKVVGNRIQIPRDGVYYIYSVITIILDNTSKVPTGCHQIILIDTGRAENDIDILAEHCFGGIVHGSNKYTSSVNGKLQLHSGQEVGVKVPSKNNISFDTGLYANFFGIYKVL